MVTAQCKVCGREIVGSHKPQGCGCSNHMIVQDDTVTAVDLDNVILIQSKDSVKSVDILTVDDINYQEKRRKRKIRKLTYEER
jgi:hypothetical protein